MGSRGTSYEGEVDNFEATELRLGLPGISAVDVLSSTSPVMRAGSKRTLADVNDDDGSVSKRSSSNVEEICENIFRGEKVQVVGWPPVRTFRKNIVQPKRSIKVSMDGAPYMRKIDLNVYKGYKEFDRALVNIFNCFSTNNGSNSTTGSSDQYTVVYEDKDEDWMLVGDVPWEMFVSSCKRLRMLKGSEAKQHSR